MSSIYLYNQLNPARVGTPSLASATARSNSSLRLSAGGGDLQHDHRDTALPNPLMVDGSRRAFSEKAPQGPARSRAPRKPDDPSSLTPVLYRASGLTGQAVALLLYLLYEHFVGVGELLHALRLQHLYYVVVVHAGLL